MVSCLDCDDGDWNENELCAPNKAFNFSLFTFQWQSLQVFSLVVRFVRGDSGYAQ